MNHDYTRLLEDTFISPTTLELKRISEDIMCMPPDTDIEAWQDKLQKITREFRFSCRFCLMRIFQARAYNLDQCTESGFWLHAGNRKYVFWDINMEHAESMLENESEKYLAYMRALARMQGTPEEPDSSIFPEWNKKTKTYEDRLITKAWSHRKVGKAETVLSRQEAFRLGHMLTFNRSEMEFFLMRVFDYEEGFRFDTSNDLIEAYSFQKQKNWLEVEQLKRDYDEIDAATEKQELEGRNENWTRMNANADLERYDSDAEFLKWMKTLAPGLDTGSRTARRIYRNLAAECGRLHEEDHAIKPDLINFVRKLLKERTETEYARELLWEKGEPGEEKCRKLARKLLRINADLAGSVKEKRVYKDPSQDFWHVPTVTNRASKFSVSDGPINVSRRVEKLLYGQLQVEKSDILFLIWVLANQLWDQTAMDSEDVTSRLQDFQDVCEAALKKALLPSFYVPHLLEQTMLLAIVCNDTESYSSRPAREYEKILNLEKSIRLAEVFKDGKTNLREREVGYHRRTRESWLELVILSQEMLEYTVEEFAEWQGVSAQSLNRYQSIFVQNGELKPFDRKKKREQYLIKLEQNGTLKTVMEQKRKNLEEAARKKEEEQLQWNEMRAKYEGEI